MSDESDELREELKSLHTPGEKRCRVCDAPRAEHGERERSGELHHRFSEHGEFVPASPEKPQVRKVVASTDLALRLVLIEKHIITYEDLARAEARIRELPPAGAGGAGGDRADRSAESAERGNGSSAAPEPPVQRSNGRGDAEQEPEAAGRYGLGARGHQD